MIDGLPVALFVCRQNAGRSQMAAAFFTRAAEGRAIARSAGTTPAAEVHPIVVEAMREVGIDLSGATPQPLTDDLQMQADRAVTMGCGDACPLVRAPVTDWALDDPSDAGIDAVRVIRDDISRRVEALADEMLAT